MCAPFLKSSRFPSAILSTTVITGNQEFLLAWQGYKKQKPMRFLLCRTDAIGDLVVTLPVQSCILDKEPSAQVFWLVRPETAPILDHFPGVSGVLHRLPDSDPEQLIKGVNPDVLLNIGHRDAEVIPAAKRAGVPVRVARPRGLRQIFYATHIIWGSRSGSGRHESQNALDFLRPLGWPECQPAVPRLVLTNGEAEQGEADLQGIPRPRLGVILRGSGSGAYPSPRWWEMMLKASRVAGWHPVALSPPNQGELPPTSLRGLMGRISACDAVIGPSTGPIHVAAAMNTPTLCLMGRRISHGPDRWAPLGDCVEVLQYPGEEDDLGSGMDRLPAEDVLASLERFNIEKQQHQSDVCACRSVHPLAKP